MARDTERRALERVGGMIPRGVGNPVLREVATLLEAMHQELDQLERATGLRPESRALGRDEVVWQTFERVAALLGVLEV
jgi:hypothetical protein